MFIGFSAPLGAKNIWKTLAPSKVRFFFWLVMHGHCWTAERRFRHGLQDSATYVLCDQEIESMDHILIGCCFSREVWYHWLRKLHLKGVIVVQQKPSMQWWLSSGKLVPKMLRRGFDSFFFLLGGCFGRNERCEPSAAWRPRQRRCKTWCIRKLMSGVLLGTNT
jgi:hypothetical protein